MMDTTGEVLGPQAAAAQALEVEAVPMDSPNGTDASEGAPGGIPADDWEPLLVLAFGTAFELASSRWPALAAQPGEVQALAKVWAPVAQKYLPAGVSIEAVAIGTTLIVLAPKVIAARAADARARAAAESELARTAQREPGTAYG